MFSFLFSVLTFLLLLSQSITAAPLKSDELLAVAPKVTSPSTDSKWPVGSHQTVTWDTTNIPSAARGYLVEILLGYMIAGSTSENLDEDHPLATQIPIMDGKADVVVPDVASYDEYVIAVIGDSGNTSDPFTIVSDD